MACLMQLGRGEKAGADAKGDDGLGYLVGDETRIVDGEDKYSSAGRGLEEEEGAVEVDDGGYGDVEEE
ncbi:hypothetical protein ACFX11_035461 [Malus domestica]